MHNTNNDVNDIALEGIKLLSILTQCNYNVANSTNKRYINLITLSYDDTSKDLIELISKIEENTILNLERSKLKKYLSELKGTLINYIKSIIVLIDKLK